MTILVGDLAISGYERDNEIYIPTSNIQTHDNDFIEGERRIVSFQIKTFIIKKKLAVGVSGKVETITEMIKSLKDFFLYRELNRDTLLEFYLDYNMEQNFVDASAIFLLRFDNDSYYLQIHKFGKWLEKSHPYVDHVFSSGSGGEVWTNKFIESANLNVDDKVYVRATIDKVLLNSMYFIEEDRIGPENFQNGWGLPIDITCYDGTFFKLDRICYVTWYVDISTEDWTITPQTILKITNRDENIFIHSYNGQLRLYGIRALDSKVEIEDWPDRLDFSSNIVCSCIRIFEHGELQSKLYSVYHDQEKREEIVFANDRDGSVAFAFKLELTERLEQSVRDFI